MNQLKFTKDGPLLALFISATAYSFYVFFPGAMTWDSLEQLRQARTGNYDDWQPPFMAYIWSNLLDIYDGPGGMLALHSLMLSASVITLYLWAKAKSFKLAFVFLALPFLPWILNFQFVIWKDVGFAYSWLLAISLALHCNHTNKNKNMYIFAIAALFIYGFLVRSNSITASVFVSLFIITSIYKKLSYKIILTCIAANLILFIFAPKIISSTLDATSSHSLSYIMYDDLVAIKLAHKEHKSTIIDNKILPSFEHCQHRIKNIVGSPFCATEHFYKIRDYNFETLKSEWTEAVSTHPGAYLRFRMNGFIHLLRINKKPYYPHEFRTREAPYTFDSAVSKDTPQRLSIQGFVIWSENNMSIFFKPYFWLLVSLAASLGLMFFSPKNSAQYWLIPISGAAYILGYIPATPAGDFRYIYFSAVVDSIAIMILINISIAHVTNKKITHQT